MYTFYVLRAFVADLNLLMSVIDAQVMFVETVTVPEWMMNPSFHDYGERTFYDGDWYFVPDQDGYESGPYRYALLNLIRSVPSQTHSQLLKCMAPPSFLIHCALRLTFFWLQGVLGLSTNVFGNAEAIQRLQPASTLLCHTVTSVVSTCQQYYAITEHLFGCAGAINA